jgi:hypothetical protein
MVRSSAIAHLSLIKVAAGAYTRMLEDRQHAAQSRQMIASKPALRRRKVSSLLVLCPKDNRVRSTGPHCDAVFPRCWDVWHIRN